MTVPIYSISTLTILFWTPVVSSYIFCSWKPINVNTDPNAQFSFQCTEPSTPIIIIENATIGYAYNSNNVCTSFIGCSQQVPDFAQYCTGYNSPCSLNQQTFYLPYASQSCHTTSGSVFILNYVYVNYSCIAANVHPPSDVCNSQLSLYSAGLIYLSTSSFFPMPSTFPYAPIQCSCSFKPLYPGVTANISIRALIVELLDWTFCSQKLTIRSSPNNDTVFCSRSVSSNVTSYVQLESNPSISFQTLLSTSTNGHFLLEILTLTSSISETIGSMTCSRSNVVPSRDASSTLASIGTTSRQSYQSTISLTKTSANQQPTLFTSQSKTFSSNVPTGNYSSMQTTAPGRQSTSIQTNLTTVQVVSRALPEPSHGDLNVSGGAIAGIVIGCFVFVILLIVIIVVLLRNMCRCGSKPRHKSLSNEKLSNDQSNGTGLTSSNGVAALRRHEPTDYNTESTTGSASNLKPDRADISGVYDIPASAYNLESIKNEKLAKQKARTQAYEMKPLPDSNSENSKQNQMIGSSTLTLMPTHEVDGRSGNINMGSGLNPLQIEGAGGKMNGSHQDDRSNNGRGGRDEAVANQDAKLKPRTDSELMLMDNNLYMVGTFANQPTPAGEAKPKPLSDSELMLVDNNLYLDGAETRAIMEHF